VDRLTEILLQQRDLDKRSLRLLERELKKHPWSQPLRMMHAKALKKLDKPGFEEAVNRAAASAPDPAVFRNILSDRYSRQRLQEGGHKQPDDLSQLAGPATPGKKREDNQLRDGPQSDTCTKNRDMRGADAARPQRDIAFQMEIIDRFIENEPRISAPRDDIPVGDYAPESLEEPEDMISETLADVLAKQGRITRAIDIFKKLSLKFPEKSSYFAKKIEAISKENNKTD